MFLDDEQIEKMRKEESAPLFRMPSAVTISALVHVGCALFLVAYQLNRPDPAEARRRTAAILARPENARRTEARFFDLPPRARESPRKTAVLSDRDRQSHGGDRSRNPAARAYSPGDDRAPGSKGASSGRRPGGPGETAMQPASQRRPAPDLDAAPSLLSLRDEPDVSVDVAPDKKTSKSETIRESLRRSLSAPDFRPGPAPNPGNGAESGAGPASQDSDAGFVDEEGLSFDTKWFEWGPYGADLVRRIKGNWRIPDLARVGWKGIVVIRFLIRADGTIEDERIVRSSGIPPFDNAAFQAIADSSRVASLPKELGSEREGVTVSFYYNIHPGESSPKEETRPGGGRPGGTARGGS